jgi:acetyl esterase/lipase
LTEINELVFQKYLNSAKDGKNPMISLVTNLKIQAIHHYYNGNGDPLQSEGQMLAEKLKEAGVAVNSKKL